MRDAVLGLIWWVTPLRQVPVGYAAHAANPPYLGFTRFSGHSHLASKPPFKLGGADITQR